MVEQEEKEATNILVVDNDITDVTNLDNSDPYDKQPTENRSRSYSNIIYFSSNVFLLLVGSFFTTLHWMLDMMKI